ncbi:hypothetical protein [Rhizorhabdus argentea]|uniref:hypothetical protein n=1 Tax=Rhizorhabdus argentea TaxID=1387174 RepID=UPI0030EF026A
MRATPFLLVTAGLIATGCAPVDPGFGESVHRYKIAQIIDPDPVATTALVEGGDGQRSAAAVQRYREGKVKEPVSVNTSSVGTAGGSTR